MIVLPRPLLRRIEEMAEAAYPNECCGLLIGEEGKVTSLEESANTTGGDKTKSFEVDPKLRFDLMRKLGGGKTRIIGHYHSHPGNEAKPSSLDLEMAFEPDLAWIIVSVMNGKAAKTRAFLVDRQEGVFKETPLTVEG